MGGGWREIALGILEGAGPAGEGGICGAAEGIFAWKGENPGGPEGATIRVEAFAGGIVPGGKEPGSGENG